MPVAVTLVAAVAGGALATALRIPAGPMIGAMLAVGLLKVNGVPTVGLPDGGRFLVYCAMGWILGESFTAGTVAQLRTSVVPILVVVALFLLFGLALAWALWRFAGFDPYTAFLSAAPGGIAQIGVFSAETNANVPLVLAIHVLRITSVIFLASIGLRLMGGR